MIRTIEMDFEYQMRNIITNFKKDFELEELNGEQFQETVWQDKNLLQEFGRVVLEACNKYSGDELFE